MAGPKFKTQQEMDIIREADAILRQKQAKDFVPEPNVAEPWAYFQIDRYVKGSFRGLFTVSQVITEDDHGRTLKKPVRKVLKEGTDMASCGDCVRDALRSRLNRMPRD
jgi:hypothetical protein